ncbi:MAG: glycosyltransferase [Patescibacteria group bacterium]|nr:glycosyltransferase [Patescibacteria group bacterium]
MRIGIDISQIVHRGSGVARYVEELVKALLLEDQQNTYILFGASLRKKRVFYDFFSSLPASLRKKVVLKIFPIPPTVLSFLWNRLHIISIEWFIGSVDIFWSSDWTQPPLLRAIGVTTIHDVTMYRHPETFSEKIVTVHKRKLARSKQVCRHFFCDSEATKKDVHLFLGIPFEKMTVIYPGFQPL